MENPLNLQECEYYCINGTKKILYWTGTDWQKPAKDVRGDYGTYLQRLPQQPTNIKSVELVESKRLGEYLK